jgi:hypothetical protein
MERTKEIGKGDFDALLCIQREMLSENRRMRLLTVWLIALTAVLLATTMITVIATV